LTNFISNKIKM